MSFAVTCKSCQARFLLNDDLLRRRVAGRVVTVRCRQCHASIEVDGSDVDPKNLPQANPPEPLPPPALGRIRAPRPAPAPPRPTAKSTLMGIGATRPATTTELVALSPGFLSVSAAAAPASPEGFPEPPPAPGVKQVLDPSEWDIEEIAPSDKEEEAAPESLDDFAEELPPSLPPEEDMPSSTGTPSLKALAQHDEHAPKRTDDFLANMSAAMNGGIMMGAPTIDVSGLAAQPAKIEQAPSIDISTLDAPTRGKQTLPLFALGDDKPESPANSAAAARLAGPAARQPAAPTAPGPAMEGSLSPSAFDPPRETEERSDAPRERKNVIVPATKSVPPAASQRTSGFAAPLLLALAAAAAFLIWKRSADAPVPVAAEVPAPRATAEPNPAPVLAVTPTSPLEPTASTAAAPAEELTFETTPVQQAPATAVAREKPAAAAEGESRKPAAEPKPEAAPAVVKEEAKPEPAPAPATPSEPAGPFDRAAAGAALTASAGQASACRKEGDPSGVASVVVTFAPSGRVTSANISGPPFAGTPTGGCIAGALRKTRIPAFDGDRVTVSKTVVIQ